MICMIFINNMNWEEYMEMLIKFNNSWLIIVKKFKVQFFQNYKIIILIEF